MDNNLAEQAIRPFTIGRKNWVCANFILGARASAIRYSIVETAKANALKAYDYPEFLLSELAKHAGDTDRDFLKELLPWSKVVQKECSNPKKLIQMSKFRYIGIASKMVVLSFYGMHG